MGLHVTFEQHTKTKKQFNTSSSLTLQFCVMRLASQFETILQNVQHLSKLQETRIQRIIQKLRFSLVSFSPTWGSRTLLQETKVDSLTRRHLAITHISEQTYHVLDKHLGMI